MVASPGGKGQTNRAGIAAGAQPATLNGNQLREAFARALEALREAAAELDAMNVYPVPDGDTGANMSATLREAVERTFELPADPAVAEVVQALAKGALWGARGNSGVILSQALRGFAAGIGNAPRIDGQSLAQALVEAAAEAYRAVSRPKEGTMLTVLRAAADSAGSQNPPPGSPCLPVLVAAVRAADDAEEATIDQLPELREAGVTDSGGEGVCVILRGLLAALGGELAPREQHPARRPIARSTQEQHEIYGFCTEFLIEPQGTPVNIDRLRRLAESGGNRSVVVVGDEALARVHAHTLDPEGLLSAASALGSLSRVKVDDMNAQNERYETVGSGATAKVAVLALSRGEGFDNIFRGLGAAVTDLGEVEKPPAGQIAEAADALRVPDVIVLANHPNVVLAAEQAAKLAAATLHVVPTRTLPQGVAAAMAFDVDERADVNREAMLGAAETVRTVEVTFAAADRTADGVSVQAGQPLALVDGKLTLTRETTAAALVAAVESVRPSAGALVTVYAGEGVSEAELSAVASAIRARLTGVDVEALSGGQPLYPFIASIE